jgi:hypothetical protein
MAGLNDLYQQYFGRDGDAEGMAYWQGQMNNGASLDSISQSFQNIAKDYSVNSNNYDQSVTSQGWTPDQVAQNLGGNTQASVSGLGNPTAGPASGNDPNSMYANLDDLYKKAEASYVDSLGGGYAEQYVKDSAHLINGQYIQPFEGGYSVRRTGTGTGDTFMAYIPDGKGGYKVDERYIKEWEPKLIDKVISAATKAIIASGWAGAAGFGPMAPGGSLSTAAASGGLDVSGAGLDQFLGEGLLEGGLESGALDVSSLGLDQYLGEGMLEGGLDVSNLGLEQYLEGMPGIEELGYTAEGGLAYPGSPGYIPPPGGVDPSNYGNEGKNYVGPGAVPTSQSPINATTGPGAAPTVPLSPVGDPVTNPTGPTTTTKPPVIPTTKTTTTTPGGGDLGTLLGLLYGAYSKNRNSKALEDILTEMKGMYKPGSPEAELMRQKIEARDAAAGRRSQYGRREVELAGTLADARMRTLSSPGFMTMQAAMMNNSMGGGGLSEILAALSGGGNGLNLPFNLNDLLNTGLLDGEGYLSDLFNKGDY